MKKTLSGKKCWMCHCIEQYIPWLVSTVHFILPLPRFIHTVCTRTHNTQYAGGYSQFDNRLVGGSGKGLTWLAVTPPPPGPCVSPHSAVINRLIAVCCPDTASRYIMSVRGVTWRPLLSWRHNMAAVPRSSPSEPLSPPPAAPLPSLSTAAR